jgi:putative addiction module component (TIGR02574 family)
MNKPDETPARRTVEEIYQEAQKLSAAERELLLAMLQQNAAPGLVSPGIDQAWIEEIRRRIRLLDEGKMKAVPMEEALQRARDQLASLRK